MVAAARAKVDAAGLAASVTVVVGDAADPPTGAERYDVVLCRHGLWGLPDPGAALARWGGMLVPGGRLVLVEGFWHTGAGLHASDVEALVRRHREHVEVVPLDDPAYWGGPTGDERYAVLSLR